MRDPSSSGRPIFLNNQVIYGVLWVDNGKPSLRGLKQRHRGRCDDPPSRNSNLIYVEVMWQRPIKARSDYVKSKDAERTNQVGKRIIDRRQRTWVICGSQRVSDR